jgi:hypothetical protein
MVTEVIFVDVPVEIPLDLIYSKRSFLLTRPLCPEPSIDSSSLKSIPSFSAIDLTSGE